jgi:hypothetical protein
MTQAQFNESVNREIRRLIRQGEERAAAMTILTSCIAPPVPSRNFDYTAWVDGREEWLQGYGPTAAAAIQDLQDQIEENQ